MAGGDWGGEERGGLGAEGSVNHHYKDILSRIKEPPTWFDEHAVPRFGAFGPREVANIYAREVVLLGIECQSCGRGFRVAFSWSETDRFLRQESSLAEQIKEKTIHYGDPPNVECCHGGPTMNSVPRIALEFWRMNDAYEWERVRDLEVPVDPDWAAD